MHFLSFLLFFRSGGAAGVAALIWYLMREDKAEEEAKTEASKEPRRIDIATVRPRFCVAFEVAICVVLFYSIIEEGPCFMPV